MGISGAKLLTVAGALRVHDLSNSPATCVEISGPQLRSVYHISDEDLHVVRITSKNGNTDEDSNVLLDTLTLFKLESCERVFEISLSEPLPYKDLYTARFVGGLAVIQTRTNDRAETDSTIRVLDLETGYVRDINLGAFCERFKMVPKTAPGHGVDALHVSADRRRVVAFRGHSGPNLLGDFAVYTLSAVHIWYTMIGAG